MIMRRFINIFAAFAVIVCAAACSKESTQTQKYLAPELIGEWHLTEAVAEGTVISSEIDVYLAICPDFGFELYQKSGSQSVRYDKFTGTCECKDGLLCGTYSNGEAWASRYSFTLTKDGLVLKSYNRLEEQKYAKAEIPADVKENANVITKSAATSLAPIL